MKILLLSNSGRPYLDSYLTTIRDFMGETRSVSFISAAAFLPSDEYLAKVRAALSPLGFTLDHLDLDGGCLEALASAQAVFIGGGNTYRLLGKMKSSRVLEPLRERALSGMPIVGWSAGSNVCGPTILTTNDWNVVGLKDFDALNLVPFNINPHYLETDTAMAPCSETRDDRIAEYHKVNSNIVLGIEESTGLWVEDGRVKVAGKGRVRRFERGKPPTDYRASEEVVGAL